MKTLTFGRGNAKLGSGSGDGWYALSATMPQFAGVVQTTTFSLPAGYSCPGARECLSRANRETGKLTDGKDTKFRCFAATMESRNPAVRKSRWNNFEALKGLSRLQMANLICQDLSSDAILVRIHVSGDFFNRDYFLAWCDVARSRPATLFYAYTKSLAIWLENRGEVPSNLKLTASKGGRFDHLIAEYNLKFAEVVFSVEQAERLGLAIDHDDSLAWSQDRSFALLLHATQPKGSIAAKALSALKAQGIRGYSVKKTVTVNTP